MIRSMTGFGDASLSDGEHHYHFELKSVNNRYFKAAIRLPDDLGFLEPELEKLLRARVNRGSVTAQLRVRYTGADAAAPLNAAAVRRYVEQLRAAAPHADNVTIDLASLAALPGVCEPEELSETQRERVWAVVSQLADAALGKLLAMRAEEGRALASDLRKHCDAIRGHLAPIAERIPLMLAEYRQRLHARVEELIADSGVKLAQDDLVKEVGIYAERSDVSEELARLTSHLEQFAECFNSGEPAGRKLDFISQEMLREANTMGSKAGDALIARHIIDIKGLIDRLKEQVQNVE